MQGWSARTFDPSLHVAVLAAHPDDETIGASALMACVNEPTIIYLTDGAPKDTALWSSFRGSREEYVAQRRAEAERALSHVGVPGSQIKWLGGVDQEAIFRARELSRELADILIAQKIEVLVTHSYEGGHPDHDTAALVAGLAIEAAAEDCLVCEMTSYHARAGRCETGTFLNADAATEFVFELTSQEQERKRRMMEEYTSQRLVLENFPVTREPLRLAHTYDFSRPPHEGRLWYEIMGWPMKGMQWRELAARAVSTEQESHAAHRS